MAKIIVLGSGLVGNVMAKDLAEKHDVTSVDINEKALTSLKKHGISTIVSDLSNHDNITKLIQDYDLVIGSVPRSIMF